MAFLKVYKNALFTALEEAGLIPSAFLFNEDKDSIEITSKKEPKYLFRIRRNENGRLNYQWCPGSRTWNEYGMKSQFPQLIGDFKQWAKITQKELQEPDLWTQMAEYEPPASAAASIEASDENPSKDEVKKIISRLEGLEASIYQNLQLEDHHKEYVKEEFAYLRKAIESGKLTWKDWKMLFFGSMINLAIGLARNPPDTKLLWQLVQSAMSTVAGILPPFE